MDNIAEQLVARTKTKADYLKMAGIGIGAVILASVFMFLCLITGLFSLVIPAVLVLFGGVILTGRMNVEYEYIVTNNEMDIDKIIGKSKRKRMITLDLSLSEEFAPYPPEKDIEADATVHASSGMEKDAYYLIVNHGDYGKINLIFNPNEKIREAIVQEVPNRLRAAIKHGL
ncbi:MAG: DUF6106 family protein [Oscillospiraceae bacterium]